ncbi:MAG: pentapeptide repeat-containing protein [Planctomycetota bacterium]|nr:pentapeptide repeat-containing protein [Planctomycetota bacterium]
MAGLFEFPHEKEEDFADLPPLIPKGTSESERDAIIDELVEAWSTPLPAELVKKIENGTTQGVTLNRVALFDAEREEPINFGDILRKVQARVELLHEESAKRCVISLRGCRIDVCQAANVEIHGRIQVFASYFSGDADFREASFSGDAGFSEASFGGDVGFRKASFGGDACFWRARFSGDVGFGGAIFGGAAEFGRASFEQDAGFWGVNFGGTALFWKVSFGGEAQFGETSFDKEARFGTAKFKNAAIFWGASFNGAAEFGRVRFGGTAEFWGVIFERGAGFEGASLRLADFHDVEAHDFRFSQASFGIDPGEITETIEEQKLMPLGWIRLLHPRRLWKGLKNLNRIYDWAKVRSISELQILTRVSYLALIIVPLLAGTWPAVRVMVNKYNRSVSEAATQFESAAEQLNAIPLGVLDEATREKLDSIDTQARQWIEDYQPKTIEKLDLPDVLGASFFAALFVVFGHLIYQLFAPELIRPRSRRLHEREARESFDDQANDRDLRLQKAMFHLGNAQTTMPWNRHKNFVHRDGDTMWLPSELDLFKVKEKKALPGTDQEDGTPDESSENSEKKGEEAFDSTLMRIAIEEGAKAEYDVEARINRGWAWVSGVFYLIASVLILWIVITQSANIGDSAGWWDSPWIEHVEEATGEIEPSVQYESEVIETPLEDELPVEDGGIGFQPLQDES